MSRVSPLWLLLLLGALFLGCDDALICEGGPCVDEPQCISDCVEFCEGAVLGAICEFDGNCLCECELSCLIVD